MNGFRDMEVYEYVSREEALTDPTGTVVGVRWVDHNKGTSLRPEVRSRLVAQEFASKDPRDRWADSRRPCMVLETRPLSGNQRWKRRFQTIADNSLRLLQRDD